MYCGFVTTLNNLRPHPNADRLMLAECLGNTVCVTKDMYKDNQIVVYFPVDGQLSLAFCEANNLIEKKDENGKNIGGYLNPKKRNIKAIRLRGEKSDGLALDLKCLEFTGADLSQIKVGDTVDIVNGVEICRKYIPHQEERVSAGGAGTRARRRAQRSIAPIFYQHSDTEQLAYNLDAFKPGDYITITRKLHGTSQRTAHTLVLKGYKHRHPFFNQIIKYLDGKKEIGKFAQELLDRAMAHAEPVYDWDYVSGTRRALISDGKCGYYEDDFRKSFHDYFVGKLKKGEAVYYEIVGFLNSGIPIMPSANNKVLKDKEFVKKYGDTTVFSYGCSPTGYEEHIVKKEKIITEKVSPGKLKASSTLVDVPILKLVPKARIYVYRMTMTNPDGFVVEYPPHLVQKRCEEMNIPMVPLEWEGVIPENLPTTGFTYNEAGYKIFDVKETAGEWVKEKAEEFYDGPEPLDRRHIREGIVVRIVNRTNFTAYKHKNFDFKCISGIAMEQFEESNIEIADKDLLSEM